MPTVEITDIQSPQLEPFRELRSRNWTEQSGVFVVEGELLVEQLLISDFVLKSVLLDRKYFERFIGRVPPSTELLVADHDLVQQLVGFDFHRGILACGMRKPKRTIQDIFERSLDDRELVVGIVGVQDPENLGAILRNCAAFGCRRVLVGEGCADPLARRVLRVSMGTALRLTIHRTQNLLEDIQWLHETFGIVRVATCLEEQAISLERMHIRGPMLVLFGNERQGIPRGVIEACEERVRIDMELGTDSLNVSVSSGIVLHYLRRLAS